MKTKTAILVYFFILLNNIYTQNLPDSARFSDLNNIEPSWTSIQAGESTSAPCETSYGFIVPNDGRLICSFSSKGTPLWTKAVKGKPTSYLTSCNDFIIAVTESSKLNLINPSGLTLWTSDCGFEVTNSPFVGRDFRIILKGRTKLACYGLKGSRKWLLNTQKLSSLPLCELNDGTLLVFLAEQDYSKTKALRISPFGEAIEEITFAGKIIDASSTKAGVVLLFYNNSCGLCFVNQDNASSGWVIQNIRNTDSQSRIISDKNKELAFICSNNAGTTNLNIINTTKGEILYTLPCKDLNPSDIKQFAFTDAGFFIADTKNAFEYTHRGSLLWMAKLPSKTPWNFICYTKNCQLILTLKNWAIQSYLMNQGIKGKTAWSKVEKSEYFENLNSSTELDTIGLRVINEEKISQMENGFLKGDYGIAEKQWLTDLNTELNNYINSSQTQRKTTREGKSFFEDNPLYTQSLINLASKIETDSFASKLAALTSSEKDTVMKLPLIAGCGNYAYDPDGEMLKSLEEIIRGLTKNDITTAKAICDSTYEICRFMGRPALYKRGKDILTSFLRPQYDKTIRDYTRKTLQKIVKLEL